MLAICANLAWTALYVNSDSPAAAIFPLLLGLGLLRARPDGSRLANNPNIQNIAAYKMHCSVLAWGVIFAVGIAVCVTLARAAEGIALDVQLAASNGEGVWALTGESISAIDDGLTLLFVGKGLGGLEEVFQALGERSVGDDDQDEFLDTLLEIRYDGFNGTILKGNERSCFVGGGGDSITIDEANRQDAVAAIETSTEYFEEVFSFSTFTWVTEAKAFNYGFTVADRRDGWSNILAWVSVVVLILSGVLFVLFVGLSCFWYAKSILLFPGNFSMYDHFTALMTVSANLAIISGSGGAAVTAAIALLLALTHGVSLLLYLLLAV
eukprot:g14931.t1